MKLGSINSAIGITGAVAGFIMVVAAVGVVFTPQEEQPAPIIQKVIYNQADCSKALESLGYEVEPEGRDGFKAYEKLGRDVKASLMKVTQASLVCNKKLKEFCMGDVCDQPGISFTLVE